MILLSWNCRGFGNPQTVSALKKVIRLEKPKIIFLMETKSDVDWMKVIRDRCGFKESHVVPSDGSSGGLALFWILEIKIQILSSSLSHIDGIIDEEGYFHKMAYDRVLWQSGDFKKVESWKLLTSLSSVSPLP